MKKLTPEMVIQLAIQYAYDDNDKTYCENIEKGRAGNIAALKELTKWKNASVNGKPMDFQNHKNKNDVWNFFRQRVEIYIKYGQDKLRQDFKNRAPVWAMFWHHVLYGTPIFDVYTHIAFKFFKYGTTITEDVARITIGKHWELYDEYSRWFNEQLVFLHKSNPNIDARTLDRALLMWGYGCCKQC